MLAELHVSPLAVHLRLGTFNWKGTAVQVVVFLNECLNGANKKVLCVNIEFRVGPIPVLEEN